MRTEIRPLPSLVSDTPVTRSDRSMGWEIVRVRTVLDRLLLV